MKAKALLFVAFCAVFPTLFSQSRISINRDLRNGMLNSSLKIPHSGTICRCRKIDLNLSLQNPQLVHQGDTLDIELFDNKKFEAIVKSYSIDVNGTYLLSAKLIGFEHAFFNLTTFQKSSFATIDILDTNELFTIRFDNSLHIYTLQEIDKKSQIILEGAPTINPINKKDTVAGALSHHEQATSNAIARVNEAAQGRDTVTIMVAYTPSAASWSLLSESNINNTISLMMEKIQSSFDNSDSNVTFKLVHSVQVDYKEQNNANDLYNLAYKYDGYMDNIHQLRDEYGADLVILLGDISFTGGITFQLGSTSGWADYGFALVKVQQASFTLTAVHEVGHDFGCGHNIDQSVQPGPGLFTNSGGARWTNSENEHFCTIMSYESGYYYSDGITSVKLPYFSSPKIQHKGSFIGDPVNADNAETIRKMKAIVAGYRNDPVCTPPKQQASALNITEIKDHSAKLEWSRGNGSEVLVVARSTSSSPCEPTDGTNYSASSQFGEGSQIGVGSFVVYRGADTQVEISSLKTGTEYILSVFEFNSSTNCFLKPALSSSFKTSGLAYCDALSVVPSNECISNFSMGSINQTSSRGLSGYTDFTAKSTTMQIGVPQSAVIEAANYFFNDKVLMWADWNQDGDFEDPSEMVYSSEGVFVSPHASGKFGPPNDAKIGKTRLRVKLHSTNGQNTDPCGIDNYGEVEDYTIEVVPRCTAPVVSASSLVFSSIQEKSTRLTWTRGSGDSILIVARSGAPVNSNPASGTSYLANSRFGAGDQIGKGNYVVYNGTGSSIVVTNLLAGTNYYFSLYEYNSGSNCYSLSATESSVKTLGNPYCLAGANLSFNEYISKVKLGSYEQSSYRGDNGYESFITQPIIFCRNCLIDLAISVMGSYTTDQVIVWADWNQDSNFDENSEKLYESSGDFISPHVIPPIKVPELAQLGVTRLRIRLHDRSFGPNYTACDNSNYGEVEDYNITVTKETSIPRNEALSSVVLMSNPVKDYIRLRVANRDEFEKLQLFDLMGNAVCETTEPLVCVRQFPAGVYLLRVFESREVREIKILKVK